jgi:hypothetical protein
VAKAQKPFERFRLGFGGGVVHFSPESHPLVSVVMREADFQPDLTHELSLRWTVLPRNLDRTEGAPSSKWTAVVADGWAPDHAAMRARARGASPMSERSDDRT